MPNQYGLKDSHIFITGGAGFIGSTLASRLVDDNKITLFDNLHNDALSNTSLKDHPNVELIRGDVLDAAALEKAMADSVEYIVHCAAIAGVDTVRNHPLTTLEVNILGVFNVLQAASKLGGLNKFVDFSTSEVFGRRAYKVDERVINPTVSVGEARWTYAISKLAGEFIAHSYHQERGVPTVTIRPFNVYGPNQVGVGCIHHFVKKALAGEDLVVHNEGAQFRSWCYVDDFVHGVLLAMLAEGANGKSYNIGNPRATLTTYHLARMVIGMAGSDAGLKFKQIDYPDVDIRVPDISAARDDLGFDPQVDIEEGLKRTIDWYSARTAQTDAKNAA